MRYARFFKALLLTAVVATCVSALVACSGENKSAGSSNDAVAATGEGISITEGKVNDLIQSNRTSYGLEDEAAWGQALADASMTPQSYREQVINSLADQELMKAGAESLDIKVEDSEIDENVQSIKDQLALSDDQGWQEALQRAGFTEEEYRQNIKDQLLQQRLTEHFQEDVKLSDEELLEQAQTYASYYDGAKRSSHILFKVEDKSDEKALNEARAKAQEVLDKIKGGADFAEMAKEYSEDTSASNGGDVGWDVLNSFVTEYTDALEGLNKGDVSDLVETEYGFHIIKVTDVFEAPEKLTKIDQLPEEFRTTITDMAKQMKANEDYQAWLEEQRKAANITINEMPADVPYNVDMTKYKSADEGSEEAATADGDVVETEGEDVVEVEEESAAASDASASDKAASAESASAESASAEAASAGSASASAEDASADSAEAEKAA